MKDKSLDIFLMMIFGISGAVVLLLAWLRPMAGWDGIFTIAIGLSGLASAFFVALRLRWHQAQVKQAGIKTGGITASGKPGTCR